MRRRGITTPPSVPGKRDKTIRIVRNASVRFAVALVSAASLFFVTDACRPSAGKRPPLVVVGVDGLEWRLVLEFAQEGLLPNLARLMAEGYAGKLQTLEPTLSPVIWTTIATGMKPEQHGIRDFAFTDEAGVAHVSTSLQRQSKAFWNLLSEAGRTCHVDGWWCTWPVEELEAGGTMVAQTTTRAQIDFKQGVRIWKGTYLKSLPSQTWPPELGPVMDRHVDALAEAAESTLAATFGPPAKETSPFVGAMWERVQQAFFADHLFLDAARDALKRAPASDLTAVYFGVTDVASHSFWRHFEPGAFKHPPPAEEVAAFGRVIRDTYRFVDASLGELRALAPDADFIVLSDHGFHAVNVEKDFSDADAQTGRIESGHHGDAPPGVFIACGPSFKRSPVAVGSDVASLRLVGTVNDVLPTLLALEDIPFGEDMAGRPLRQILTDATLEAHPIRSVATHEDAAWRAARARAREHAAEAERHFEGALQTLDAGILKTLKAIGYTVPDTSSPVAPPRKPSDPGKGDSK
jgi:hypothetical protein